MKRLIPAAIILTLTIALCFSSHIFVKNICHATISDINKYNSQSITTYTLKENWDTNKEKLSFFVNHSFLDQITIYISQLTIPENTKNVKKVEINQNIKTILYMIEDEQRLSLHSFY